MAETRRRIKEAMVGYDSTVSYSELRKRFEGDTNFLDQLSLMITSEEVIVAGWDKKKSEYPMEAVLINELHERSHPDEDGMHDVQDGGARDYALYLLTRGKKEYKKEELEKSLEPHLILTDNIANIKD